ncbi:hypothetical protein GCK72_006108 [Caenorhabditis remanei]|uniref:Uncharacterized protein n=1 Tax=Caenorhabditis remanei TaxID=31234 RepID=A0A6A5HJS6_CAERE|nr:hypothetical protein GCK72_006108 [Caenorhabditis remanei]KAF1766152.1 hypothetical protein GCK72_006108 [Caenorhabditis remanei]
MSAKFLTVSTLEVDGKQTVGAFTPVIPMKRVFQWIGVVLERILSLFQELSLFQGIFQDIYVFSCPLFLILTLHRQNLSVIPESNSWQISEQNDLTKKNHVLIWFNPPPVIMIRFSFHLVIRVIIIVYSSSEMVCAEFEYSINGYLIKCSGFLPPNFDNETTETKKGKKTMNNQQAAIASARSRKPSIIPNVSGHSDAVRDFSDTAK